MLENTRIVKLITVVMSQPWSGARQEKEVWESCLLKGTGKIFWKVVKKKKKRLFQPCVVAYSFNPSTSEAEVDESL